MLIRVMYADGRLGLIKPQLLDSMADRKLVSGILRSDGWALVGRDIIRSHRRSKRLRWARAPSFLYVKFSIGAEVGDEFTDRGCLGRQPVGSYLYYVVGVIMKTPTETSTRTCHACQNQNH